MAELKHIANRVAPIGDPMDNPTPRSLKSNSPFAVNPVMPGPMERLEAFCAQIISQELGGPDNYASNAGALAFLLDHVTALETALSHTVGQSNFDLDRLRPLISFDLAEILSDAHQKHKAHVASQATP